MYQLTERYDYAIYKDKWQGQDRWQAYWLEGDEPLPVAPPTTKGRSEAELDAASDWLSRKKDRPYRVDPTERTHPWTGQRRFL